MKILAKMMRLRVENHQIIMFHYEVHLLITQISRNYRFKGERCFLSSKTIINTMLKFITLITLISTIFYNISFQEIIFFCIMYKTFIDSILYEVSWLLIIILVIPNIFIFEATRVLYVPLFVLYEVSIFMKSIQNIE